MAIIRFINSKAKQTAGGLRYVLRYTMRDEKTVADDGVKYVSGVNCTPLSAYTEFNNTKRLYGKTDGRQYYHFLQSFSTDESITPQTAHEIALRFAEEAEKLHGFEIVVSTHCDRDHIHSHFVMNSVSAENGKKFHIGERDIDAMMQLSDRICREYGLSVLEPKPKEQHSKPMSDREYRSAANGQSWKIRLEAMISNAMRLASSREHFIRLMELEGYGVTWTDTRKNITYTTPDGKRCRDSKLHYDKFLKENMEYEFIYRSQITARFYSQSTGRHHDRRGGTSVRRRDREELERDDQRTARTDSNPHADPPHTADTGDTRRDQGAYGYEADRIDNARRTEQDRHRRFSGSDEGVGKNGHGYDCGADGECRETGWETERGVFEESLFASGTGTIDYAAVHQTDVADSNDPVGDLVDIGIGAARLVGRLGRVIDDDHPKEDCTTKRFPRERKKKHGPTMGGM